MANALKSRSFSGSASCGKPKSRSGLRSDFVCVYFSPRVKTKQGVNLQSNAGPPRILRFGIFELDVTTGEMRKAGVLIHLPPQPFKILALLASRAGQLVTREEIHRQIWGSETFVDFEHGLNFAIKRIREALSDNAEALRYIETLPRRGYRFIAHLETAARVMAEDKAASQVASGEKSIPQNVPSKGPETVGAPQGPPRPTLGGRDGRTTVTSRDACCRRLSTRSWRNIVGRCAGDAWHSLGWLSLD